MRRLLVALLLGANLLAFPLATPAHALFGDDCDVNYTLDSPTTGVANGIDPGPANPRGGDPFGDGDASIYEAYGYAGLNWPSFDCGVTDMGAVSDPGGSAANTVSNMSLDGLAVLSGINASLQRFTFSPTTLDVFDPVMRLGTSVLGESVFKVLFWITLLATALLIIARAARARLGDAFGSAGWVVFVGILGIIATTGSLVFAPQVDRFVTGAIGAVNMEVSEATGSTAATPADGVASNLHHSVLYETWCSGMVGRSAGETADEFCPRFLKASTLSRAELREVSEDQGALDDIASDKEDDFNDAADDLKEADPAAYGYLIGDHNTERLWYSLLGWFAFMCASPFLFMSSFLLLFSLIILRAAIMVMPLVAVVGGFPPLRRFVTGLLDYVMGAFLTAIMFGAASAVFIGMIGGFLSPESQTHPLLAAILLLVATIAVWKLTKPIRRVKHMAGLRKRVASAERDQQPSGTTAGTDEPAQGPRQPQSGGGGIFTPTVGAAWAGASVPAEAQQSVARAAVAGAARGAAATAVMGAASGGTVTAGAMAAGAAQGAGGAVAARALSGASAQSGPAPAARTEQPTRAAEAGTPAAHALPAAPARAARTEGPRVYRPGEHTGATPSLVEPTTVQGERVYPIYTPETKGAAS